MAALFQSFPGSGMPKRLLRYALLRLDLFDAEALDLDNIDLALGRNTVLDFRDVQISRNNPDNLDLVLGRNTVLDFRDVGIKRNNPDNLDLALGRNTVLEFRDVGIKRNNPDKFCSDAKRYTMYIDLCWKYRGPRGEILASLRRIVRFAAFEHPL
ncbi:hypothetical protein E4U41_005237 [Claviceps citrina]|nr:hypothetical protein E4U41_005237 [Claviceps citrina]